MKFPKKNRHPRNAAPALSPPETPQAARLAATPPQQADRLAVSLPKQANRCAFATADGRQCRMPRWEAHASLCLFHARQEQQLIDLDRVSAEFRSLPGEFKTNGGLNSALHQLLTLVAHDRVPPRKATTLAYIAQLLLRTLPGIKQEESLAAREHAAREQTTARRAFPN